MSGTRIQQRRFDPDDEDRDDPDEWRDCAEDKENDLNERADHEGWPPF